MINGSDIISLDCSSTVLDTIFFMKRNNVRRIVVTCESKLYGIFTVDEALREILERSVEERLRDVKLKKIITVRSNDPFEISRSMITGSVDSVIHYGKIITEKDVVRDYQWNNEEKIYSLGVKALTIEGFTRVSTAAEIMVRNSIRHLPVVDDEPVGMLSSRDIVYRFSDKLNLQEEAKQVMIPFIVKGDKEMTLREGVDLMLKRGVGSLVVPDKEGLYIITFKDLIKHIYMYSMKI
ncbi:CBS domain-containing protein [Metallosphaera tengchongensis]|uniref:CBS domain-containing protein n=1 Tax=Metallosphaera tengchongensis TaxID=1532350 RepID=A0A6N0NSC6_9CREN|nr:CBS domain-containing protein [Metallosphaera tengchongensis]QKQ99655.1 CBS domain-containing protein [Metallosphaera tengchongensis]